MQGAVALTLEHASKPPAMGERMADVFISYAHGDRELAAALAGKLSSRGYSVWWDHELVAGAQFRDVITEQLGKSQYAIVIWTAESVKSKWVVDEAAEAQRLGKLIPVKAAGVSEPDLPYGLRGIHALDISDTDGIIRSIRSLMIHKGAIGRLGFINLVRLILSRTLSLVNRYSYEYGLHIAICFILLPVVMDLLAHWQIYALKNEFGPFDIWHALAVFFPALGWANLISRLIRRQHDHGIFLALIILSLASFILYLAIPATGAWRWYSDNFYYCLIGFLVAGGLFWIYFFYRTIRSVVSTT
jgi:hypothetical protein